MELSFLPPSGHIKELQLLDQIEQIQTDYQSEFGHRPINVSTWDPSTDVIQANLLATMPEPKGAGRNYIFSYTLGDSADLRRALGYSHSRWRSLVSHSGSASIAMTCNWLRASGAKKILILGPRYFTVPHCLEAMGIKFDTQHFVRDNNGYRAPGKSGVSDYDGVWITNPIYGTGVYIDPEELIQLHEAWTQKDKFFVVDECLASPSQYVGPSLVPNAKTTILAAPHKSVCVNAYKFAVSIVEQSQLEHFEHWSDVWLGCLPQSSHQAIDHFLNNGFESYRVQFESAIHEQTSEFIALTNAIPLAVLDQNALGYFRSVYFPKLSTELGLESSFLREATFSTGTSFIPGIRNDLDPSTGLSFRVNLAAFNKEARGAYVRLCRWLSAKC